MEKRETFQQCCKRWAAEGTEAFVGAKIVKVDYLSADECKDLGWYHSPPVLTLDNGLCIYPSRDDEGNDAGALLCSSPNKGLPVIDVERMRR